MSEMVERAAAAMKNYVLSGRGRSEWFVDTDPSDLPGGVFLAGPFDSREEADHHRKILMIKDAIEAMREPTQAMLREGGLEAAYGEIKSLGSMNIRREKANKVWRA